MRRTASTAQHNGAPIGDSAQPCGAASCWHRIAWTGRAAYSVLPSGATSFGNINVAAAGTTNYDPDAGRWGDYSWAVLDPSGASVWMATEYVPPKASQTTDGVRDWGTRVMNLPLP